MRQGERGWERKKEQSETEVERERERFKREEIITLKSSRVPNIGSTLM
jgi:hypothetical protein